jgi:hypothetical protein
MRRSYLDSAGVLCPLDSLSLLAGFAILQAIMRYDSRVKKVAFVLGILLLGSSASPAPAAPIGRAGPSRTAAGTLYVIGAAGDIACNADPYPETKPDNCQYDDTADLLTGLTLILALGDNQYPTGSYTGYTTYYDPTWGQYLANTNPVPGNHEYAQDPSSTPRGYFRYFGDRVKGPTAWATTASTCPRDALPGRVSAGTSSRSPPSFASPAAAAAPHRIRPIRGSGTRCTSG